VQDLKTLVKKIQDTRQVANRDLSEIPEKNRPGLEMAANAAKLELDTLTNQYAQALLASSRAVFVTGDPVRAAAFVALPAKEGESLTLDPSNMYRRIADELEPMIANSTHRCLTQQHIVQMVATLREIGLELELTDMPMPKIPEYPILPNYDSVLAFARDTIRNTMGDDLSVLYMTKDLAKQGIKQLYCRPVTNVMVINATPEEEKGLTPIFAQGVTHIEVNKEDVVNDNFVANTLQGSKKAKK
jgi:hypothetical protein